MANHDYVVSNGTGAAVRSDLNLLFQAVGTSNSGNSAPSTIVGAGMQWWDSNGNTLYIRNTANDAWIAIAGASVVSTGKIEPGGDTAASDNAAIGYTSAEGLILTGQGSTSDITVKNDADATVFTIPTGTDDILFPDNAKTMWGTGSDLTVHWDGTDGHIAVAGTLNIDGSGETLAKFIDDGAVELYHNGTKMFATDAFGCQIPVDGRLRLGASQDLQIYHDGTDSRIDDSGTGDLILRAASNLKIEKYTGETMAVFANDGAVTLYYDNAAKLATTSGGITVTGAITGTLATAAQTNITSLGTLSALTVSGLTTSGTIKATSRMFVGDIATSVSVSEGQQNWTQSHDASNRGGATWFSTHNSAGGAETVFAKGRSGSIGSYTIAASGDTIGSLTWCGDDGTNMNTVAARIIGSVDGTPGENDMPGSLTFWTTADGAASATEHVRLTQAGNLAIGATSASTKLAVTGTGLVTGDFNLGSVGASGGTRGNLAFGGESGVADGFTIDNETGNYLRFKATSTASAYMVMSNVGKLGLGTTAPEHLIDVQNTANDCTIMMGKAGVTDGILGTKESMHFIIDYDNNQADRFFAWDCNGYGSTQLMKLTEAGVLSLPDNGKFTAGTGSDFNIYHDGSNSYIDNSTGILLVRTSGTKNALVGLPDSSIILYHDGNTKLTTTSTGVTVTGRAIVPQIGTQTAISLGDDAVTSFTPPIQYGFVLIHSISTDFAIVAFDASTGTAETTVHTNSSGRVAVTTGILSGTTGTDGKLNFSAHTNGTLYIENRMGGGTEIGYTVIG